MENFDPNATGDPYLIQSNALSAWFLGPRAENAELFNKLVSKTFELHENNRRNYYPTDPAYVTLLQKISTAYRTETQQLEKKLTEMNAELSQSTPIFSPRFQGHMNWDITMPSYLGYISGMLWNSNNVDVTASPVTTSYEILVGDQICDMIGFDRSDPDTQPWGHITCGGSIANIEALWSSRNLKFYALSLRVAVKREQKLEKAKSYMVQVPAMEGPDPCCSHPFISRELSQCSTWQLLNIDVDEACKMAHGVATKAGVTMDDLSELVHKHSFTSQGIAKFLKKHNINSPHSFCPATCHYSWPKAATVLGLGEDNLILVEVDRDARQKLSDLKAKLDHCLKNSIPVISVTAVMGSTEESAMDPLVDILQLREEFRLKGLNFCVLADAAWGAYMITTLIDPYQKEKTETHGKKHSSKGRKPSSKGRTTLPKSTENFPKLPLVSPVCPLSQFVIDNLNALRLADTVTSDPHKTGYCPYPAGGLSYRNGTMKEFVRLAAPEVFHSETDLTVGVNGLEGSKPGAAASGALLSHRVIGLDKYGYGRILGQCVYGSKMFYCMWLHLAKPTDPFIMAPYKPCLPEDKKKIKELINGKTNVEIVTNKEAMALLARVGPDALINKIGMNVKVPEGTLNELVDVSTDFSKKVGSILSVNVHRDAKRTPMIMFQSLMEKKTYGPSLEEFKKELGLTKNTDEPFGCLVNTVMNPWQTNSTYVTALGQIFREACFNAYGWMYDEPSQHRFVVSEEPQYSSEFGWYFFANLCAKFGTGVGSEPYHAVVKFANLDENEAITMRQKLRHRGHLFIANADSEKLYVLLEDTGRATTGVKFNVYPKLADTTPTSSVTLKVLDVIYMKHFEPLNDPDLAYPNHQTYLMFGDGQQVFLSHKISKVPDFQQVVEVLSHQMTSEDDRLLLWYGIKVTFPNLEVDKKHPKVNPFTRADRTYTISFAGREQEKREMQITLADNTGWFDHHYLNQMPKN